MFSNKSRFGGSAKDFGSAVSRSALVLGASLSLIGFSSPALAQAAAPQEADQAEEETDDTVIITGSRIRQRDFETASPIATVGAEEIALTGTLNVEELLNSLPQVVPGLTVTSNNPSLNGFATADLRGLGPGRTLVLVNGRRANPSDRSGAVDLNTIPAALIERVEVITGGASAVYGADAVAGAINFIMKDDFEGLEANLSYGSTFDDLAPEFAADVTIGTPFDDGRGNITAFAGYYSRASVPATERSWTNARGVALTPDSNVVLVNPGQLPPAGSQVFASGGSATSPWSSVTGGFSVGNIAAVTGLTLDGNCDPRDGIQSTGGTIRFNNAGGIEPYQNCAFDPVGNNPAAVNRGDRYDFAPDNFLVLENERLNTALYVDYDLNESVNTFLEMTFTNSRSKQQLAATPVTGLTVRVDLDPAAGTVAVNPYVAANSQLLQLLNLQYANNLDNRTLTMNTRPNQGGFRVGTAETNAIALTGGFRGSIEPLNMDWEVFSSYARNSTNIKADNNVGKTAITQLINACGVTSNALQAAPITTLPNCPFPNNRLSPFTATGNTNNPLGLNSMNAAQLAFINVDTTDVITYERSVIGGFVSGELGDFWGAGSIGYAAGGEYREEELDSRADPFKAAGDIFGFNAQESIQGSYDVREAFAELSVPILSNLPFVDYLGFEGGYRFSEYSTGAGTTDTYKGGFEYRPVEWLNFRAIYNRAVRAPTAFELFQGGDQNFPSYADPCNQTAVNALAGAAQTARIAACTAWFSAGGANYSGLSPFSQVNTQVQSFQLGTPGLQPEIVDTYTYGVVFNPEWWPVGRIGVSIDSFLLDLQGGISLRGIGNIINACTASAGTGTDCLLTPRRSDGNIDFVNQTRSNVPGHSEIKGIDYNVRWSYDLAEIGFAGDFGVAALVTWIDTNEFGSIGTHSGGIGGGEPEYRAVTSFSYNHDKLSALLRWSWTDELLQPNAQAYVPAYNLWSIGGRYDLADNLSISANIDNLFDEQPPVFPEANFFGQYNTDGSTYDQLGRSFRIGLTFRN